MTEEEYKAAIEQYKAEHSAGGSLEHGEWKRHKYIRIENGRYIYPEDLKKNTSDKKASVQGKIDEFNKRDSFGGMKLGNMDDKTASEKISSAEEGIEKLHELSKQGQLLNPMSDKDYQKRKAAIAGEKRTLHELNKENARLSKDLKNLEELEKHQEAAEKYQDAKDREAKKEQQARQEETKKITSMTPDEARKRAAELTKQNTPEKDNTEPINPTGRMVDTNFGIMKYVSDSKKVNDAYESYIDQAFLRGEDLKGLYNEVSKGMSEHECYELLRMILPGLDNDHYKKMYDDSKKVQHSDPRTAFYAAVYDYKQAHKR